MGFSVDLVMMRRGSCVLGVVVRGGAYSVLHSKNEDRPDVHTHTRTHTHRHT